MDPEEFTDILTAPLGGLIVDYLQKQDERIISPTNQGFF